MEFDIGAETTLATWALCAFRLERNSWAKPSGELQLYSDAGDCLAFADLSSVDCVVPPQDRHGTHQEFQLRFSQGSRFMQVVCRKNSPDGGEPCLTATWDVVQCSSDRCDK